MFRLICSKPALLRSTQTYWPSKSLLSLFCSSSANNSTIVNVTEQSLPQTNKSVIPTQSSNQSQLATYKKQDEHIEWNPAAIHAYLSQLIWTKTKLISTAKSNSSSKINSTHPNNPSSNTLIPSLYATSLSLTSLELHSFDLVELVVQLETHYNVEVNAKWSQLQTIGDIVEAVWKAKGLKSKSTEEEFIYEFQKTYKQINQEEIQKLKYK